MASEKTKRQPQNISQTFLPRVAAMAEQVMLVGFLPRTKKRLANELHGTGLFTVVDTFVMRPLGLV
jgi:hypothetical protein